MILNHNQASHTHTPDNTGWGQQPGQGSQMSHPRRSPGPSGQ